MVRIYPTWLRWIYKMDLAPTVIISWKAKLDKSINPRGVHIGDYTWVLSGATILAHDLSSIENRYVYRGKMYYRN